MIAHQHPGKYAPIAPRGDPIQQSQPVFPIPIAIHDHPPFPPAGGHVIKTVLHLDA
jgi:hypothetical protein